MFPQGSWYNPDALERGLQRLENFYQEEGFLNARVGPAKVEFQHDPANVRVALIRVPVFEGPRYLVGALDVKNVEAFPPATLLQLCPLQPGQPYSRRKVAEWQRKIEDGYRTMGYIRFQSAVRENVHAESHMVDCTLDCTEGKAYSVGSITVIGDSLIDRSDFKRHLLVGEGGLYNPEMLSLSIQFLNQMNIYQPIKGSDIEIKIDDAKGTVDLAFHLILRQAPGHKSD
jgi:outer membrane protein insertion porin family